jgi:diguanylate cyclase (GGDEF)-like protein
VVQTAPIIHLPETRLGEVGDASQQDQTACLIRIYPAGVSGGQVLLTEERMAIGRDSCCHVELMDDFISRVHAFVVKVPEGFEIRDNGSLNGTYVNDQRIERQLLVPGDQIRLGNHIFKFLSADHVEAQYHETVYEMMTQDALTGAHNKRYFEDAFARELLRSQRHWRPLSLVLFDVDHFKAVNDRYGHLAGDECLKLLARRVNARVRGDDLFARYGGEEFALALPEASLRQAARMSQEIRQLVAEKPFATSKGEVPMTISLGVGFTNGQSPMTADELIQQADDHLYRAKKDGRNCVRF